MPFRLIGCVKLWIVPCLIIILVLAGTLGIFLTSIGLDPAFENAELSLAGYRQLLTIPGLLQSAWLSFVSGVLTTFLSVTIVLTFLAGAVRTRRLTEWVIGPLLAVPHVAAAIGFAFLIAPSGWLMRLLSPWLTGFDRPPDVLVPGDPYGISLIIGLVIKEVPFLFLVAIAALPMTQEKQRLKLARSLGYGRMSGWMKTVAPEVYLRIRLPVMAVIVYASSNVEVALVLGPSNPPTLAVSGLKLLNDPDLEMRRVAAALGCFQMLVTGLALLVWLALEKMAKSILCASIERGDRHSPGWAAFYFGRIAMTAVITTSACLVAALFVSSFAWRWRFPDALPQSYTLNHWSRAGDSLVDPVMTSLSMGIAAAMIGIVLVVWMLEQHEHHKLSDGHASWMTIFLFLPLLLPQISFVAGLVTLFESVGLRPGYIVVLFGHLTFVIPYVFLALRDPFRRFDQRYMHVARSIRASRLETMIAVRLPMLSHALLSAMAIGFAVSIGLYLPTLLLGAGRTMTVTTEAMALISGGDRRVLGVWSLVQTLLPALLFLVAVVLPKILWRHRLGMQSAGREASR